jgi:diguanylate cyclase (GGDEF)-like protein/PAS domain S-box-containing protein
MRDKDIRPSNAILTVKKLKKNAVMVVILLTMLIISVSIFLSLELIDHFVFLDVGIWTSHVVTILGVSIAATAAAYLIGRKFASTNVALEARILKERWYHGIFEASSDGIFVCDPNLGRFTEVNKAGCTMFGYGRLELVGCDIGTLSEGVTPYTQEAAFPWFEKAQFAPQLFEWHCKRKDGHLFWVEIALCSITFGDDKVGVASVRDITKKRELEKALEAHINIIGQIATMAQRLQSCRSNEEIADAASRYGPQILPDVPGALCVFSNSRNLLRVMATWNDPVALASDFPPTECWGLRRGQTHTVKDTALEVVCQHVDQSKIKGYSCRPLVAQEETLGLLYLEAGSAEMAAEIDRAESSVDLDLFSESLSLALGSQRLHEKLRDQSIRDPLTGLFNRRYLEEALELDLARAARGGFSASLIMGDVDQFKQFNDRFGHDAGDLVLKRVAETMQANVRKGDVVARYGGEEFLVLLHSADLAAARQRAELIRYAIKSMTVAFRGQALDSVTVSLGIATFPTHGDDGAALITAADSAMYAAKHAGRDRVEDASGSGEEPLTTAAQPAP